MSSRVLIESGNNRIVRGRYGYVLYNKNDIAIGRMIEAYGEYFESEVELFRQLCKPGQIALDIGANIGTHTLALSEHVGPTGRVYAFEAQRLIHQMLCANVALNGLINVQCVHAAVGAKNGLIYVADLRMDVPQNFGGFVLDSLSGTPRTHLIALDHWIDIPAVHLMKIDVEGMELDVLRGAVELIKKFRPVLYVENDRPEKSRALLEFIDSMGYRIYWHLPPDFNPKNAFGNQHRLFPQQFIDDGGEFFRALGFAINILCIPNETTAQMNGFREMKDFNEHPLRRECAKMFATA